MASVKSVLAKALAARSAAPMVAPSPGLGPILDQLLPPSPRKKPWWPANQNIPPWERPNLPFPGNRRPPWVKPFGKRPPIAIGGLPFRPMPWANPLLTMGAGLALQYLMQPPAWDLTSAGFRKCCDIGLPILDGITFATHSTTTPCTGGGIQNYCGLGGQVTGSDWTIPAGTVGRWVLIGMKNLAGTRQTHSQIWWRASGSPSKPAKTINRGPRAIPVDPLSVPGNPLTPQIDPVPMPDPFAPVPVPRPRPSPRVKPVNPPVARPRNHPGQPSYAPTVQVEPSALPGARPVPVKNPSSPRTKERKLILAISKRTFVGVVLNVVGETADFIECFYDALPKNIRREFERKYGIYGKVSASQKLFGLWQHFARLDWNAVIHNLVMNELEDRFFGKIGKLGAIANRIKDNYTGYGSGGFQLGYAM